MMRRTLLQLGLWAPAWTRAGEPVWLRIRNDSRETFEHVWQGWPERGTSVDLGPLAPGQASRWQAFPAALPHYRKTRVQLADRQLVHVTDTAFPHGQATLAPGRYTFAYTLEGAALRLTVTEEADTPRP